MDRLSIARKSFYFLILLFKLLKISLLYILEFGYNSFREIYTHKYQLICYFWTIFLNVMLPKLNFQFKVFYNLKDLKAVIEIKSRKNAVAFRMYRVVFLLNKNWKFLIIYMLTFFYNWNEDFMSAQIYIIQKLISNMKINLLFYYQRLFI